MTELRTEILVVGGGLGGIAAALGRPAGRQVVMSEEFGWIGGQLTSQAVPPDEHSWVEQFGITRSYRALRDGIRQYYRDHYPLTEGARAWGDLNPGGGLVSRICAEPRVGWRCSKRCSCRAGRGQLTVLQPSPWQPTWTETTSALSRSAVSTTARKSRYLPPM